VWNAQTGAELLVLKGHANAVRALAFSPDGRRLASGGDDRTIKVWEATGPTVPRHAPVPPAGCPNVASRSLLVGNVESNGVQSVRFSPDGRHILTSDKAGVARIWDAATLAEERMLCGHKAHLSHANFSPDGQWISSGGRDRSLRLWETATGKELRVWPDHVGEVYWSRISKDRRKVVCVADDGWVRLYHTATGETLQSWMAHEGGAWTVEFFPDEQRVITSGVDGILKVWDVASGRQLMAWHGHRGLVIPVAVSPDGQRVASGGTDHTIRIWDAGTGRELLNVRGHGDQVWDVNFSPDGRRLISAAFDQSVRIWDAASGRQLLVLRGKSDNQMTTTFSPDGACLAYGGNHPSFEVWDAATEADAVRWREEEEAAAQRWAAWGSEQVASARAARPSPDLIKSWLILAPIPLPTDRKLMEQISEEQLPGESRLRPRAGELTRAGSQELAWKPTRFDNGVIDFNQSAGPAEYRGGAAYAVCYVRSDRERRGLRLKLGSDDQSRLYLNGRPVCEKLDASHLAIDRETVEGVELRAGINVIVFKIFNEHGSWSGALRFTDDQDQPVEGLEFTLNPD
jgi:WD40 repeat protein